MNALGRDMQFSVRTLLRSPGFTTVAVLTIAVGIGLNAAVFAITNATLFRGFSGVDGNDRILYIGVQKDGRGCCASYPDYLDWREQAASFEDLAAVADLRITLSDSSGFPESCSATQVSANAFAALGERPILGRDFVSADERPGAAPVGILTYRLWERRYGKDPAIVGRSVRINGTPTTVIGVMPKGFLFPQNQDLWLPLVPTGDVLRRDARGLWFVFGRMRDRASFESVGAELEQIGSRLAREHPRTNEGWVPRARNFSEFFISPNAALTYGALWGAVGFVLLIACANLANLMLARAIGRGREMSVRIALGAGRWRIVRHLLIESLMLSAAGGLIGWWIALWSVRAYALVATPPTRSWADHLIDYSMDGRVVAYLAAISIATGLLFGLAPAPWLARLNVGTALKDGGRGTGSGRRAKPLSALLATAEMALAIVLLAGAAVMTRSFVNMATADIGITTQNTTTFFMSLPAARYPDHEAQVSFYDRLKRRLEAIAGVESVAITSNLPAGGARRLALEHAGGTPVDRRNAPVVSTLTISADYFRTLGAAVVAGREFNVFDGTTGDASVIVNQRFARIYWPDADPLGKRLRFFERDTPGPWSTVVGVVSDIVQGNVRHQTDPVVYRPYQRIGDGEMWIVLRSPLPLSSLTPSLRREIDALDSDLPIWLGPYTLDDRLAGMGSYWSIGNDALLFLIFAVTALLLASLGLYAVVAHAVSTRVQEIGVRVAVGATSRDILGLVFKQGMMPVGLGLAVGVPASFAVNRVLQAELVQVSPSDPAMLSVACVTLIAAATLGCLIPARRAIRIDPVIALRE